MQQESPFRVLGSARRADFVGWSEADAAQARAGARWRGRGKR